MGRELPAPGTSRGALWVAAAIGLLVPTDGNAQRPRSLEPPPPDWVAHAGLGAANILAAGVTTALTAWIRGADVEEAFARGSVGGAGVYLGKRVATEDFDGAGLLGRQLAAVGSSVAANGGMGRGWVEEVWLPLGPFWTQVSSGSSRTVRLDLSSVAATAWAGTRTELEFDWAQSLSNGAAIFVAPGHSIRWGSDGIGGFALPGVAVLGARSHDPFGLRAHEMIHVIQMDYLWQTVSRPLEALAWRRAAGIRVPVDIGVGALLMTPPVLNDLIEAEAELFTP